MEFLDEDARPRFLFQSRPQSTSSTTNPDINQTNKLRKPILLLTISLSLLLLLLSIFFLQSEPFKSLLFWVSLSFVLGPFAPATLTGGDISVGQGPILDLPEDSSQSDEETKKRVSQKRSKPRRSEETAVDSVPVVENANGSVRERKKNDDDGFVVLEEEKEWVEEEIEFLKKQLLKHPVGKPRRWEAIAEAFRGRHKVESVIKKAKELGERKLNDADSYSEFLKKRKKAVDQSVEASGNEGSDSGGDGGDALMAENGGVSWSSGEDIALLKALKAFPKEVSMRWEKIAAAVPGKSKAACTKRVTELKRDFRSSKASANAET
ncbi:Octamer-binding transcription factor [Parasponia andersonii]|uniref:Octamer-binding transcription factor n=1 Tax=Parasponia andersonii TaxID=3476 RepID=A0A2P5ABY4_PARAD|nr:Octamer-binding transcription factor [Parasponia andersonii]